MSSYQFRQEPKAVYGTRSKFREPEVPLGKTNLMFDRRVVRGNTYATPVPTNEQVLLSQLNATTREFRPKKMTAAGQAAVDEVFDEYAAISGRQHMEVQTDDYLEELVDEVFQQEQGTQTDPAQDKPDPVVWKPPLYGTDEATQVEQLTPYSDELFDFDAAADPILQVMMGQCLDNGHNEVLEEEEIKALQNIRAKFNAENKAFEEEVKRMEDETVRAHEEKEGRLATERARLASEQQVSTKLAAMHVARCYLAGLQNTAFAELEAEGVFYDPVRKAVEAEFLPWLNKQVRSNLNTVAGNRKTLDTLLAGVVERVKKEVTDKAARLAAEAAEAQRKIEAAEAARIAAALEAERVAKELALVKAARALTAKEAAKAEARDDAEEEV